MNELVAERLKNHDIKNARDQINAVKEIAQEIILYGLSQTDFFDHAFFGGGTCLRILHGLERFSEDLDFTAVELKHDFNFDPYMEEIIKTLKDFGFDMLVTKSKNDSFVKMRMIKEDSEKWKLSFPMEGKAKKMAIKVEIDVNPLSGAESHLDTLNFPVLHRIRSGNLDSLFAGKVHALLCRPYTKGRDWYDFLWYMGKKEKINLTFLENALSQMGSFKRKPLSLSLDFVKKELVKKIKEQDWNKVADDVSPFIKPRQRSTLKHWETDIFLNQIEKLS